MVARDSACATKSQGSQTNKILKKKKKTEPLRSKTRGKKIFFNSFRIPDWVKKIKLTKINKRKVYTFY